MLQCKALYWKSSKHTLQVTPLSSATINLHTQQKLPVIPSQSLPPRPTTQNLSCLMTIKEAVIRSCAGASSLTSRHNLKGRFLCLRCYIRRHYEGACSAGSSLCRMPYASQPLCARARAHRAPLAQRAGPRVPPVPRAAPSGPSDSGHASRRPCPETPLHTCIPNCNPHPPHPLFCPLRRPIVFNYSNQFNVMPLKWHGDCSKSVQLDVN